MIPAIGRAINNLMVAASEGGLRPMLNRGANSAQDLNGFSGDINGLMTFW
jgi:hypothetical protein